MANNRTNDSFCQRFSLTIKLTWHYLALLAALFALFYFAVPSLSLLPALAIIFVLFFFRNPKRVIPAGEGLVLSPADGVIMEIDTVQEEHFIKDMATRVYIFLSIFDVHLNRSPLPGTVSYRQYRPGQFLPAFKSHASEINEKNFVGVECGGYKILVCQVTGFVARRIKCWVGMGQRLAAGEVYGIIKFGSGTALFLPPGSKLSVKKGDRVRAGETIIGTLPVN